MAGERVKFNELKTEYNRIKKEHFLWCYEVTKCAPEQAFSDLKAAFANYWRMKEDGTQPKLKYPRKDGEEAGFPHFKSKKRDRKSFYLSNDQFSIDGHTLHVPKIGDVNMTEALRIPGKIMSATISERAGWWFISITVEIDHEPPRHKGGSVGIDLGLKTLATCSDGSVFENQKHYRRNLGRIKGLSKGLSRKVEEYEETGASALSRRLSALGHAPQDDDTACTPFRGAASTGLQVRLVRRLCSVGRMLVRLFQDVPQVRMGQGRLNAENP